MTVVRFFDESEEAFLELVHRGLRIIEFADYLHVFSFHLRNGLLDQLHLMVLVRA